MAELRNDNNFAYIDSATTTQVKTGDGQLVAIVIGTSDAGSIKVIDGVSGTTTNLGEIESDAPAGTYWFNTAFGDGLRIVTGAATKITVVYN